MESINRGVITVQAKQPFIDWINSTKVEGDSLIITMSTVNDEEPAVYLVPSWEDQDELNKILKKFKPMIFEAMLNDWYMDESAWPRDRSNKVFDQWFSLKCSSMVEDICSDQPLFHEED